MRRSNPKLVALLLLLFCWACAGNKSGGETAASADTYYKSGEAKLDQNDLEGAIADFDKAIEIDPRFGEAYVSRGFARYTKNDFDAALADQNKAVEIDPSNADAYLGRGMTKARKGDSRSAIDDYNKALEIDPRFADAYRNRAVDRSRLNDLEGARADYQKTLEIDPEYAYAYVGLGLIKSKQGDYAGAIADYEKGMEVDPNVYQCHVALAWLLATCPKASFRDGRRAIEHATRAAEMTDYQNPNSLGTLGAAYAETGNFNEAIKWQEQALTFPDYEKEEGEKGRQRLELYRAKKPYREP